MKKLVLIILTCMIGIQASAEKRHCVVIHERQGQTAFDLEKQPVVSFTGNNIKLVCGDIEVLYPMDNYLKMTIEEAELPDAVEKIESSTFSITEHAIIARGCDSMALFTIDGKSIAYAEADENGMVYIFTEQLGIGVYIVKIENNSFKIYKR